MERCRLAPDRRAVHTAPTGVTPGTALGKRTQVNLHDTTNFKAQALDEDTLRRRSPSIFAAGPMQGVQNS